MLSRFLCSLAVLGLVIAFPAVADASLQVTFTVDDGTPVSFTVVDQMAGDLSVLPNEIIVAGAVVDGYAFTLTLVSTNSPGGPLLSFVESSTTSIADTGKGPATVSVYANSSGFTAPTAPPALVAVSGATATLGLSSTLGSSAAVSYLALIDTANGVSAVPTGIIVGSDSGAVDLSMPVVALSDSTLVGSLGSPYALNLYLEADFPGSGSVIDLDGVFALSPIPEPGTIVVWSLLGVLGLAPWRKTRR